MGSMDAAMAQLTAARSAQMVDTCRVTRAGQLDATPELDDNGNPIRQDSEPVYEGLCTISDPATAYLTGRTTDEQSGVPNTRVGKLPHSADLRPGDVLVVTASRYSPGLVGDTFTVIGEEERSYATYRRYNLRGSSWLAQ